MSEANERYDESEALSFDDDDLTADAGSAPPPPGAVAMAEDPSGSSPSAHASLKGRCEEIFRGMWASLFYSGRTTGKTVLLTSSSRREGTSTMACGLALAGSGPAGGARVALVDFNLRAPAIHEILGVPQSPGLVEALGDGDDIARCSHRVNDALDVFPVGNIAARSLDVLRGDAMGRFFHRLGEEYDFVLVDSAAANHFPDAQVLGGVLKEVVLVVRSQQTPREAVAQAKKRIEAGGGKIAGIVMNMRTFPIPSFLYRRV